MNALTPISQITMTTARLTLRPLRPADESLIAAQVAHRSVAEMTRDIPHPLPDGEVARWIAQAQAADHPRRTWAIDGMRADLPQVLGLISLTPMDRDQSEISTWIAPEYWSMGLASEALEALLAANPHEDATLFGAVFQENPASAKLLTKCGFQYLGDAEAYSVARGSVVATWTYMRRMR